MLDLSVVKLDHSRSVVVGPEYPQFLPRSDL